MKPTHRQIADLVHREGLIRRSEHPELSGQIGWLARWGELTAVLRGTYVVTTNRHDPDVLMLAAARVRPDGIVVGDAAARLGYAGDHRVETVAVALGHERGDVPGFQFDQRRIPGELVAERNRIRFTVPALTALDLTKTRGGDAIDECCADERPRWPAFIEPWRSARTDGVTATVVRSCSIHGTSRGRRRSNASTRS